MNKTSDISGFYKLDREDRLKIVKKFAGLSDKDIMTLKKTGSLDYEQANRMIENVIGTMELPLGIAVNFLINGKDYLIPMAIEESSVVAAASNGAKIARVREGFEAESTPPEMIGQIQLTGLKDMEQAKQNIMEKKDEILELANEQDPVIVELGGGAKDLKIREIETPRGAMIIIDLIIDVRDAMGANVVNTMAEAVAPLIEKITGGRVYLRIVSNLATHRLARAKAVFDKEAVGGEEVVDGILEAYAFAASDPYRCATHNKGVMNGVVALALATGNDTRALESGAHSYSAIGGNYRPLTSWTKDEEGNLIGEIEIPVAAGIIGGATKLNPVADVCLKILGVESARELGEVMASLGLAQNLAALRALASEGIQRGHMRLHARNIASLAGAKGELIDEVAKRLINENQINVKRAEEIIKKMGGK